MPNPTLSRVNGRSTIRLTPSSDLIRVCATAGHSTRKAVSLRVTKVAQRGKSPAHTVYRPECAECANRKSRMKAS